MKKSVEWLNYAGPKSPRRMGPGLFVLYAAAIRGCLRGRNSPSGHRLLQSLGDIVLGVGDVLGIGGIVIIDGPLINQGPFRVNDEHMRRRFRTVKTTNFSIWIKQCGQRIRAR